MAEGSHSTIAEMMENYAAEAVRLSEEFEVELDFSELSLQKLEGILTKVYPDTSKLAVQNSSTSHDVAQQKLDSTSRIWGAYFGETIRRLWGGEWGVETYPGTVAPVISVDIGGAKVFPVMKVYRRLTQGDGDNVWEFYKMIRTKITSGSRQ